jgi:hypothetical protein
MKRKIDWPNAIIILAAGALLVYAVIALGPVGWVTGR